jgi:hypothetical protein
MLRQLSIQSDREGSDWFWWFDRIRTRVATNSMHCFARLRHGGDRLTFRRARPTLLAAAIAWSFSQKIERATSGDRLLISQLPGYVSFSSTRETGDAEPVGGVVSARSVSCIARADRAAPNAELSFGYCQRRLQSRHPTCRGEQRV